MRAVLMLWRFCMLLGLRFFLLSSLCLVISTAFSCKINLKVLYLSGLLGISFRRNGIQLNLITSTDHCSGETDYTSGETKLYSERTGIPRRDSVMNAPEFTSVPVSRYSLSPEHPEIRSVQPPKFFMPKQ
jgi:hypothetical protein